MKALRIGISIIVLLFGIMYVQAAQAQDRRVYIINNTSATMTNFYASNINRSGWEEDILGSDVLPSGSRIRINIDDRSGHCLFDLKAVFNNGTTATINNFNVCRMNSWTVTD